MTFGGNATVTGNLTATAGQNAINLWSLDKFILVDGIHFAPVGSVSALCAALGIVPSTGAVIIDTFVEAFTVNPFSCTSNPVWVQFGANAALSWTTTVPIVTTANQWITGAGPQQSFIKAIAGFPAGRGIVELGAGAEIHSAFVRDIGLSCTIGVVGCTGLVLDGAQNPSGASNVNITNYTQDGVRLQQTSAATSAIKLDNMWAYSDQASIPSGSAVNINAFSGQVLLENFVFQDAHAFPGAAGFKVGGGSGQVTFLNDGGEGATDEFLLTGTGATTTIIGAGQSASSSPGVNTVHVGAGVFNYTLINVSQGNNTGAALVDDNRTYTCTGQITYLSVTGSATKYDYGSCPTIGWIRTPATTVTTADLIQLQAGFVPSNRNYNVLDNSLNTQFGVTNDGRVLFRGNQTGAFVQIMGSDTLTANRVPQFPNGPSATVMVAALVTTAAVTDNVTIQGMTASGHCSLTATNAAAAAAALPSVTTKAANQITVTHAVTANMNYDVLCTSN